MKDGHDGHDGHDGGGGGGGGGDPGDPGDDGRAALAEHLRGLTGPPLASAVDLGRIGRYRGYAEQVAAWLDLAASGARVRVIGHSVAGAPLAAVEFGPPDAARTSVVLAGLHPIEWIGVETGLALCRRLARRAPGDRRVVVFPLVNVDGYRSVEDDLRAGRRRWRRSNRRGVDLNRNWPAFFAPRRWAGFRGWGNGGPEPLSEPETRAVADACDAAAGRSTLDVAVSLHSFGRMILTPWGGRFARPERHADLHRAACAVRERLPRGYKVKQTGRWLPGLMAHGIEIDTLHRRYGAIALLVECSRGGLRLRRPGSWLHPFRWYNPPEAEDVAGELASGLEPLVRGELTGPGGPAR